MRASSADRCRELGSLDQRVHGGGTTAAFVRAGKGPVATSDRDAAQYSFGGVVGHAEPAVIEEDAQVDATLNMMATAIEQMRVHVEALSAPNNDATTIASIVERLKAGTDQLDAAIATAQAALKA